MPPEAQQNIIIIIKVSQHARVGLVSVLNTEDVLHRLAPILLQASLTGHAAYNKGCDLIQPSLSRNEPLSSRVLRTSHDSFMSL